MGPQRVLQVAAVLAGVLAGVGGGVLDAQAQSVDTSPAPRRTHERVAVIDLGPSVDPTIRQKLAAAVVAAGLDPVIGDGVEDALAGQNVDKDSLELAVALAEAQRAFGVLDCKATLTASTTAIAIGAMRQAAGLPVPELPRALTYALLCADRAGDVDAAMLAASRLRTVGGSPDVPAEIWRKYPEVDTILDRELVALEITADVPGAVVWIDLAPAGTAPLQVQLTAGEHLIAVAAGSRRGWAAGRADPTQRSLVVPTTDRAVAWSPVAQRIASWKGAVPSPDEIGWVLGQVRARVALIRHGDTIEAWGRSGRAEAPRLLGGDDGTGTLADARRVLALVADRAQTWNDRAPDPDRPLLVEDPNERTPRRDRDSPTRWWVYASIIGAVAGGAALIYAHDSSSDRQRVELHLPRVSP